MDVKEVSDNENETEYVSVEDPLNMHKTASNETAQFSEIPNIIIDENVTMAPGRGKIPVLIVSDKFCEGQAYLYLLLMGKFGYNASGGQASN